MKIWAVLGLSATMVLAQDITVLGTIRNKDKGQIVFTTLPGACEEQQKLVYATGSGGDISLYGCWAYANGQFFVVWSDKTIYSYPIDTFEFTADAQRLLNNRN
jgi:hypothetical protein